MVHLGGLEMKIKYGACALHVEILGLQAPTVTPYLFFFPH